MISPISFSAFRKEDLPLIPKTLVGLINYVISATSSFYLLNAVNSSFSKGFYFRYFQGMIKFGLLSKDGFSDKNALIFCIVRTLKTFIAFLYFKQCGYTEKPGISVAVKDALIFAFILSLENILVLFMTFKKLWQAFSYDKNKYFYKNFISFIRTSDFYTFLRKALLSFAYFYFIFVANVKSNILWAFLAVIIELIISSKTIDSVIKSDDFFLNLFPAQLTKLSTISKDLGFDLVEKYRIEGGDPVLGRDSEIKHLCQILCTRDKGSAILIGEPGVGKTAIINGLAQAIAKGNVPLSLRNKKIFSLNLVSLMAGTKWRGQLEKKINTMISSVLSDPDIILFIDEIHIMVSLGKSKENAMSFSEILKPYLASGAIKCIGATTFDEYELYVKADPALLRRFESIEVKPPTVSQAIAMLNGLKASYGEYYNCCYSDDAIRAAVELSEKYIPSRQLPDKAIEFLNQASVFALDNFKPPKDDPNKLCEVSIKDVEHVLTTKSGVSLQKKKQNIKLELERIKKGLSSEVIGQDEAIECICSSLKASFMNIKHENSLVSSCLILGQHGSGRKHLAKSLAKHVMDGNLTHIDLSDYTSESSFNRLIGAPRESSGSYKGLLTERVKSCPNNVILLDNIEAAHPNVISVILRILRDGFIVDSYGTKIDFTRCILIISSGYESNILDGSSALGKEDLLKLRNTLISKFNPVLLEAIEQKIVLNELTDNSILGIVKLTTDKIIRSLQTKSIFITVDDSVKRFIAKSSQKTSRSAKSVVDSVYKFLECKIADALLELEGLEEDFYFTVNMNDAGDEIVLRYIAADDTIDIAGEFSK